MTKIGLSQSHAWMKFAFCSVICLCSSFARAEALWKTILLLWTTVFVKFVHLIYNNKYGVLGKLSDGRIPLHNYIIYHPIYFVNWIHCLVITRWRFDIPVATEICDGWWLGGRYAHELNKKWGGILDCTIEFPESCEYKSYLCIPTYDGIPASPSKIEEAANYCVEARKNGPVLVHCAYGRGRSTTILCAALVKAGIYKNWQDAYEIGIKPKRTVVGLKKLMKEHLEEWQNLYVDVK